MRTMYWQFQGCLEPADAMGMGDQSENVDTLVLQHSAREAVYLDPFYAFESSPSSQFVTSGFFFSRETCSEFLPSLLFLFLLSSPLLVSTADGPAYLEPTVATGNRLLMLLPGKRSSSLTAPSSFQAQQMT